MTDSPPGETRIRMAIGLIGDAFGRCVAGSEPTRRVMLDIAGEIVALDIYGIRGNEHLSGVFRHLIHANPAASPTFHIDYAELDETGREALKELSVPPPGLIVAEPDGPMIIELHEALALAVDRAARRAIVIASDPDRAPSTQLSRPFAHIFGWLAAERQSYVSHGAVIGTGGRGLLFAGNGGQGKSTTALTCAAAGWDFAGDDLTILARDPDGSYRAHSLFATGRLHPAQAARFPSLVAHWDSAHSLEDDKLTLFPRGDAIRLARRLPVEAIVLPLVSIENQGEIARLPRATALRSLLTDSIQVYPWLTRERAQFYASVVETLPCYTLRVGPDLASIPASVLRVLDQIG